MLQVANSASALADESTIEAAAGTVTVDTAFIYGDANGNGKVDSDDVSLTAQSSLSLLEFTSQALS